MPHPQRPLPPERPDPAVLLIDAVIQRQQPLVQRLAQQWVHRRGWPSFEAFVGGSLLNACGDEAIVWLRQGLGLEASPASPLCPEPQPRPHEPGPALQQLLREALAEAISPLREPATAPAGPVALDPWQLAPESPVPSLRAVPITAVSDGPPAPAPADLAALRSWLHSDAA